MLKKDSLLLTVLKFVAVSSCYLGVTGPIVALIGSASPVFVPYAIIFICTVLSFLIRKIKVLWIVPLMIGSSSMYVVLLNGSAANFVWILPVYIYSCVFNAKKLYYSEKYLFIKSTPLVRAVIWTVPFISVMGSVLSSSIGRDNGSFAFGIALIASAILLMRYSRHKSTTVATPVFNRMNFGAIAMLFLTAAALLLIAAGVLHCGTAIILWIVSFAKRTPTVPPVEHETPPPAMPDVTLDPRVRTPAPSPAPLLEKVYNDPWFGLIIMGCVLTAFIFYMVVKTRRSTDISDGEQGSTVQIQIPTARKKRHEPRRAISNRNTVRKCYRSFIQLCIDNYIPISDSKTAGEINEAAKAIGFCPEDCDALYRIYTLARYSDAQISDADAQTAKDLLNKIKKHRKNSK